MFTIKPLNKISTTGLSGLPTTNFKIDENCDAPDGMILRSFSMHDMDLPDSLLAVARAGAGVNNIPLDKCGDKGIVVFNTPGANANAVKELAITGMLLSCRKVIDGLEWAKTLSGDDVAKTVESGKANYVGSEIKGKTIGIIGLGAIGKLLSEACYALGMTVIGYDPFFTGTLPNVKKADDINEIYKNSDYISLHLPYLPETKNTINSETIGLMKKGVKVMNFARGELVNNSDILKAIEGGQVANYIVDFPVDELINKEGVIAFPHLGASTPESEENCAIMAASELKDYLENGNIVNSVNYPNCKLDGDPKNRVCVMYKSGNLEKISKEITHTQMSSAENSNYGYAMYELSNPPSEVVAKLESIEEVIKVRTI